MADTIVRALLPPSSGTVTLNLYEPGSATVANTGGDTATEGTGGKGYEWTVTEALAGLYLARLLDSDGGEIGSGAVVLADDTGPYYLGEPQSVAAAQASQDTADAIKAKTDLLGTVAAKVVQGGILEGGEITLRVASYWSGTLTDLGDLTGYTKVWLTIKRSKTDTDALAVAQWSDADGLLYLDSNTIVSGWGTLTIDDAVAGNITMTLEADAAELLRCERNLVYDVKGINPSGKPVVIAEGIARVDSVITKAIA